MRALAVCLMLAATPLSAEGVTSARYADPTDRYTHAILGDALEWGTLVMKTDAGRALRLTLPHTRVFEDTAPRLSDVDRDGEAEVIVVETDLSRGARLAIYDPDGLVAATEFIGQPFRWLAPVGAADLDGDGRVEIAYVDRPHLAKTLRIFRFASGTLTPVADYPGVTNHRIGETDIAGGIRDCGSGPQMIVATADWSRLVALNFDGRNVRAEDIGPHDGRASFAEALGC